MDKEIYGFFNDDGTPINPNLVTKPSLCVSCRNDDDPQQEKLCMLTLMDHQGEEEFRCAAYEKK
ncbi:MAG: hypothetical protein NTZ78_04305 [Candidatus Aureabacteria bacterium]|nr:hypothetical protein [Candidatus Auribacterota bacterium]